MNKLLELAEAAIANPGRWNQTHDVWYDSDDYHLFREAATPQAVVELCKENERLREASAVFIGYLESFSEESAALEASNKELRNELTVTRTQTGVLIAERGSLRDKLNEAQGTIKLLQGQLER